MLSFQVSILIPTLATLLIVFQCLFVVHPFCVQKQSLYRHHHHHHLQRNRHLHDEHIYKYPTLTTREMSNSVDEDTATPVDSNTSNRSDSNSSNIEDDGSMFPNLSIIGICGSIGSGKSYTSSLLVSKLNSLLAADDNNDDDVVDTKNDDNVNTTTTTTNETKKDIIEKEINQVAFHIDTDSLAHGVYTPGSAALQEIEQVFGSDVINKDDGTVDRKVLGEIVFSDDTQMAKLEQIVWPHVKNLLLERLDQIESMNNNTNNQELSKSTTKETTTTSSSSSIVIKQRIAVVEAAVLLDANWDDNQLFDAIWVVRSSSQLSAQRLVTHRGMDREDAMKRMEAQLCRRGIGNLEQELLKGTVTAVIDNDGGGNESDNEGTIDKKNMGEDKEESKEEDGSDLWNTIRQYLTDPTSWKEGRCPTDILEEL